MEIKTPWLKNKATGIVSVKAPVGDTRTVSGNPVSIDNPSGLTALTGLNVDIQPSQDLNGYDHPWVGGAGDNLLGFEPRTITNGDLTVVIDEQGKFTINGSHTAHTYITGIERTLPAGTYTVGERIANTRVYVAVNGTAQGNNSTSRTYTFTLAEASTVRLEVRVDRNVTFTDTEMTPHCSEGSNLLEWSPYENICPITGHTSATVTRTGKNLLKPPAVSTSNSNGISFTYMPDGGIVCNGTSTAYAYSSPQNGFRLPVGQYVKNAQDSNGIGVLVQTKTLPNWTMVLGGGVSDRIMTISADDTLYDLSVRIRIPSGITLNDYVYYPMIRLSSETDDTYEPYQGQTVTIDLNGTVYGGTLDVLSGVLTIEKENADLGNCSWKRYDSDFPGLFYTDTLKRLIGQTPGDYTHGICSCYKMVPNNSNNGQYGTDTAQPNGTMRFRNADGRIYIVDERFTDATALTAELAGETVVFELHDPTTVQLTPKQVSLLTGTNIISTDMNSLTVTTLNPDWQSLIDPSSMKVSRYDLDAGETTGRNLEGYMLRDRQAVKEKIEMEFPPMYASDFHTMMELTKEQSFYVWYYSPYYGKWRAADMYVGDREGNLYYGYDSGHAPEQMWTDIKFNFIER